MPERGTRMIMTENTYVVMCNMNCTYEEFSGKEHSTSIDAMGELDEAEQNPKFAGVTFWIKTKKKTIITHNVVCSIIHGESKLELCTFANGDRAFLFYYQGELKHTQRITTHMVNPISHMGMVLLELMDRNMEREFDR